MHPTSESLVKKILPDSSPVQLQQLLHFVQLLSYYGERINLVSQADRSRLWENQIFPSIIILRLLPLPQRAPLVDVGSGGGLPAIPLKIMRPDLSLVLIESNRKKAAFLKKVIQEIGLTEVEVLNIRLIPDDDRFAQQRSFAVMTARAVASLKILLPLARLLLKPSGFLLSWKGETDLMEIKQLTSQEMIDFQEFRVPEEFYPVSVKFCSLRLLKVWFTNRE
jgi:16S rRNA (guanine527-N7)-methyltransferase